MRRIEKILILIIVILVTAGWIMLKDKNQKIHKLEIKNRTEVIKSDSLILLKDGYYRKIVADTLDKKQIKTLTKKIIDLQNRKPKTIIKTVTVLKEVEKPIDSIVVKEDSLKIVDYYPNKENPFLKYENRISLLTKKGKSNFKFKKIEITGVILQRKDGLFDFDLKVPEFMEVGQIDIQALPMTPPVKDNWGYLFGINYGRDFERRETFINLNTYLRYKKFYIGIEGATNGTVSTGIKIEF